MFIDSTSEMRLMAHAKSIYLPSAPSLVYISCGKPNPSWTAAHHRHRFVLHSVRFFYKSDLDKNPNQRFLE